MDCNEDEDIEIEGEYTFDYDDKAYVKDKKAKYGFLLQFHGLDF